VRPIVLDDVSVALHLPVAAASAVLLSGVLAWKGGLSRSGGLVLVSVYAAYVVAAVLLTVSD
jgi:hypothetical protein